MSELSTVQETLESNHTQYREYTDGDNVTLVIFGLNAPEVMKFRDGKYIGKR